MGKETDEKKNEDVKKTETKDQSEDKSKNNDKKTDDKTDNTQQELFKQLENDRKLSELDKQNRELQAIVDKINKEKETARQKELEEQGKYEELIQDYEAKHQKELNKAIEKQNELFNKYQDTKITNELNMILTKANVNPKAIDDVTTLLKDKVKLGDDMETLVIENANNLDELVNNYLKDKEYLMINNSPGGGGSPKIGNVDTSTKEGFTNAFWGSINKDKLKR
jgi:hypothetical protein